MIKFLAPSSILTVLAIATFSLPAMAVPYGPAGCGVGHMVVGSEAGFMQIFASTTNGTFANQSFGITSGTLGCDASGGDEAQAFIEANREALAKDAARGNGEAIANLSALAGCTDVSAVGATLQANFGVIFRDATVSDRSVGRSMVKTLKRNPALQCGKLI